MRRQTRHADMCRAEVNKGSSEGLLVGVALSAMIRRRQAYLKCLQQHNMVE